MRTILLASAAVPALVLSAPAWGQVAPPATSPSVSAEAAAAPIATPTSTQPEPAAAVNLANAQNEDVIVTGTRASGLTAAESAAPIKLISADTLSHVGQPNLNQVLNQLVPSFQAAQYGGDTAALALSAKLRGLSPNDTLVLVNGKRRHGTADLAVLSGSTQGGAAPDLDFIPPASIGRIEVLEDGAAAQYGSDAIAGVINIITKKAAEGGTVSVTGGKYYKGDGAQVAGSANLGFKLGEGGWLNLTGMYRWHDFAQVGGLDRRLYNIDGSFRAGLSAAQLALYRNATGAPYVNRIFGDPQSRLESFAFDGGYDLGGGVTAYAFGTYGHRTASAYENFRVPDRVVASPVLGVAGNAATPGELIFAPRGFNPREGFVEDDFSLTGGIKGENAGWAWDLSATFGKDRDKIYTYDSANASLFVDTHFTPTNFYDGKFANSELTVNADVTREIETGMAGPLNLAFGAEYRRNIYSIGQGDAGSIYKEGGQSYPGFQPTDAGTHERTNESVYVDIAAVPIDGLKLDAAGRFEHYSDFGSKVIGKFTARYDFSDAFALRGTVANGFRAPTLAEEYYSATNVSPTAATVQLPANSAAAKVLGFQNLKPETSFNLSAGAVFHPVARATLTADFYHIHLSDRIVATGTLYGAGGTTPGVAPANVIAAILAHGNVLDPTVTQIGVSAFTNGLDTNTDGVDVVATYLVPTDNLGAFSLSVSGNYTSTKIDRIDPQDTAFFDRTALNTLTHASPKFKIVWGLDWKKGAWSLTARETLYGHSFIYYSPDGATYYKNEVGTAPITDLEIGYKLTKNLKLSGGANNLFDKRPEQVTLVPGTGPRFTTSTAGNVYDAPLTFSPYGINGGYWYGRLDFTF
jgi:iron complex outermembrane receptor protein